VEIQQGLPYNRAFDDGSKDQHSAYRREFAGPLMSNGMSDNAESAKFKIGELVRMIGSEEVGEVVSLGERGLFVRYNHDSETVTFFPEELVERAPTTLDF